MKHAIMALGLAASGILAGPLTGGGAGEPQIPGNPQQVVDQEHSVRKDRSRIPIPIPVTVIPDSDSLIIGPPKVVPSSEIGWVPPKKKSLSYGSIEELKGFKGFPVLVPARLPGSYGSPVIHASDTSVRIIYTDADGVKLSLTQTKPVQEYTVEEMPQAVDEDSYGIIDSPWGKVKWRKLDRHYSIAWESGGLQYQIGAPRLQDGIDTLHALVALENMK
ncbi:hypothetical protein PM3016_1693 [Paenibacillus mucilaginosus 3016]|uniref:DUF4367 domain-containing protein n=1 Tax=Paenibacillus mucilaginosus 3016 TaxID=1116391 RepID=H6NCJ4_9BACL|nr:hypothetical protein [Paenibacillus mucilaginosus]AFC28607.1 hypothetical protein PM3016_1693 [Paenibacillus mucilaginosus 3016]WFA17389.1 hypothetical protein ERY13_08915 [Paenibacillus mucilaginosus]